MVGYLPKKLIIIIFYESQKRLHLLMDVVFFCYINLTNLQA